MVDNGKACSRHHTGQSIISYASHGLRMCLHMTFFSHTLPMFAGARVDLVLSSGFLAFASHSGFLQAVQQVCDATYILKHAKYACCMNFWL